MRTTITALIVAAGLGFAASAQAAPVAASKDLGAASNDAIVHVQMTPMERRMMERRMMERRADPLLSLGNNRQTGSHAAASGGGI